MPDARGVHDEQVTRSEVLDDVREPPIEQLPTGFHDEEAALASLRHGLLRDQFGRKCVVEVGGTKRDYRRVNRQAAIPVAPAA